MRQHDHTTVLDVRSEIRAKTLAALADNATLQWRKPLALASLARIEAWIEQRPCARIRLYGNALEQLPTLAAWRGLRILHIGPRPASDSLRAFQKLPAFPSVRHLALESSMLHSTIAESFPQVRSLRIATNAALDVRDVLGLSELQTLDLADATLEHLDALQRMPKLRALRLARCMGAFHSADFGALVLHTLALEDQPNLHDLQPLANLTTLEQLTLFGFWQFSIDELAWLFTLPNLRRASLDMGGRRKNVELYRRGGWARSLPFEEVCHAAAQEQVHTRRVVNPAPTGESVSL